jgi:hypothetical protein
MTEQTVVEIEPVQLQRRNARIRSETQLRKADLTAIAGDEMLVLAACLGNSIIAGLELKEKKRVRRFVLLIVSAVATAIALTNLAMQLLKS